MRLLFSFLLITFYFASTAQIPSYVPTNGLVGWWPFNGNANDESGNGNNGVPMNGISLTTDRFGNNNRAYYFDGVDDFIDLGYLTSLNNLQKFTLSYWLNSDFQFPTFQGSNIGGTFAHWTTVSGSTSPIGFEVGMIQNGATTVAVTGGQGSPAIGSITAFSQAMITIVFDGNLPINQRLSYYINGQFYQYFNVPVSVTQFGALANRTIIGGYIGPITPNNVYFFFKGVMDDFGIWNKALSQSEITQLYTSTTTSTTLEDTTSNVGIGTTTPKRKLHVNDVMRLEPRDTAPANPAKGDIYFDGVLNKLRYYNGTGWISL